jgi:hypothetical protein
MKKYPSKYSNGKSVSAAQYITEMICEKRAKTEKRDLHYRFWTNKEWSAFYRNQIASANKLLKQYSCNAIVRALNNPKMEKIYSLRAPHLIPIIELEEAKILNENNELTLQLNRPDNVKFEKSKEKTSNIISKLKDIDNGD